MFGCSLCERDSLGQYDPSTLWEMVKPISDVRLAMSNLASADFRRFL